MTNKQGKKVKPPAILKINMGDGEHAVYMFYKIISAPKQKGKKLK